jgi:hypothetical protein
MSKTTDSLAALITYLDGIGLRANIDLHGAELPAGWKPRKAVLILPDGGPIDLDLPVIDEVFSLWCYGVTAEEARVVADDLCGVLHRMAVSAVTLAGKKVYVGPGEIVAGPMYFREPETLWQRWIIRARVRVSETPI